PDELIKFYNELIGLKNNNLLLVEKIVSYYGYSNAYCNTLITDLQAVSESSFMSLGDIIHYMEESIDNTITIDSNKGNDAINVQTIHASKGLEYPVVFVADCNQKHFPSSVSEGSKFMFNSIIGIRGRYEYGKKGKFYYNFNNWSCDLVSTGISRDYDEFRRLLYVAITRCKQYLYLTASNPSPFFKEMDIDPSGYDKKAEKVVIKESNLHNELEIGKDYTQAVPVYSPHDFMDYHPDEKGRGTEFGNKMHHFAERIANGIDVPAPDKEFQKVKDFILKEDGKLMPEIECSLPLKDMIIRGIIDLVIEKEDIVEIIDYKTDVSKLNLEEYRKQLSVYYHVVKGVYPKKKVVAKIYWTGLDEVEEVDVIRVDELQSN
ncbi:MAG: PD-(D/E)XK nuclease family protein, partial [Nanoarchaeota archaeon]|nr:PD-(D/E)XK nuclease family protein [Nanoarchaeota archaeon]